MSGQVLFWLGIKTKVNIDPQAQNITVIVDKPIVILFELKTLLTLTFNSEWSRTFAINFLSAIQTDIIGKTNFYKITQTTRIKL